VLHSLVQILAARDTRFVALVRAYEEAETSDRARTFQKMFEAAMLCWLEGGPAPGVEPWPVFRDRVREELARIVGAGGSRRRIAVFTSGGPIGVAVQTALAAPDRSFLEVNWRVRNCSVTEFVFGGGRLTLDSFNSLAHLEASLQTWR
jgi:broad specificity phosphatase PhoE